MASPTPMDLDSPVSPFEMMEDIIMSEEDSSVEMDWEWQVVPMNNGIESYCLALFLLDN